MDGGKKGHLERARVSSSMYSMLAHKNLRTNEKSYFQISVRVGWAQLLQ